MERRLLLVTVAAAIAGNILSTTIPVHAHMEKHAQAIARARDVLAIAESNRPPGAKWVTITPELTEAVDGLLGYLLDQFPGVPTTEAMKVVLESSKLDFLDTADLATLADAMVPVAILRELIRAHGVGLNTRASPNYQRFIERYADTILRA